MALPEKRMLNAYLRVMREAIIYARALAYRKADFQLIGDLMDAIHVIPELINKWEECDEPDLKRDYLQVFDNRWAEKTGFSLLSIYAGAYSGPPGSSEQ